METRRDDVGIAIRSAFLTKGTKQRFSLFVLIVLSILLIFLETYKTKPLNYFRALVKDTIYRGALVVSTPLKAISNINKYISEHANLYRNYKKLQNENNELKNDISKSNFLELENSQLRKLIEEQVSSSKKIVSARVMMDKQSPYLNSYIINIGNNKKIKNGMEVLDGKNFIGRTVDVNFFSTRVLLVSDLNSKIPVVVEPSGNHSILSGRGINLPTLEYLPVKHNVKNGDKIYTSGREGIFSPGIPIGEVKIENNIIEVLLFSDLDQVTFVHVNLENKGRK